MTRPFAIFGVLSDVHAERRRQDARWGEQNHPDGVGPDLELALPVGYDGCADAVDLEKWARDRCNTEHHAGRGTFEMILTEEWAETLAAPNRAALRTELVQLAAVAVAWVEKLDREDLAETP